MRKHVQALARRIRWRLLFSLWQLQCQIFPNRIASFVLVDGSRFAYPLKSEIGRSLFCGGFEEAEIAFVRRSLRKGDIFLDIGANGGIFTIIAAKQVGPTGHIYAFEPGLHELELLRNNIRLNKLTNVTVIERAVSDKSEMRQFAVAYDGAMNSLAQTKHPSQRIQQWRTIQTISLDDFVEQFSITKVDFIKIDIEGAERLVFQGAHKFLASSMQPMILFESSAMNTIGFGYSTQEFLAELSALGLALYCLNA